MDLLDAAAVRAFNVGDGLLGFDLDDDLPRLDRIALADEDLGDVGRFDAFRQLRQFEFDGHGVLPW